MYSRLTVSEVCVGCCVVVGVVFGIGGLPKRVSLIYFLLSFFWGTVRNLWMSLKNWLSFFFPYFFCNFLRDSILFINGKDIVLNERHKKKSALKVNYE